MVGDVEVDDRRRWWARTTRTKRTRSRVVGRVKKSIETGSGTWFARNVRQVWEGRGRRFGMRPDTVRSAMDAELQELAVYARRTPQRIRRGHRPDEHGDLGVDAWAAAS
jgi:hypothetical protein